MKLYVTKKGERLIARKLGIPYGLLLAYIYNYPFAFGSLLGGCSMILVINHYYYAAAVTLILGFLIFAWAANHFNPKGNS